MIIMMGAVTSCIARSYSS